MAKSSAQLFRAVQVIVLALCGLLLSIGMTRATAVNPDSLIQQGFSQFNNGQFNTALQLWRQAETTYRQAGNAVGVAGSLINQSLAQQAIGQDLTACYSAAEALVLGHEICRGQGNTHNFQQLSSSPTTVIGLKALGESLRGLGYLEESERVLQQALQRENQAALWNSLGETYVQSDQRSKAIAAYQTAIKLAAQTQQSDSLANAQINLLALQKFDASAFQAIDLSAFPGVLKAQAQLKIAHTVIQSQPQLALEQAQAALVIGQTLQHSRTIAEALTLIGEIRNHLGQPDIPTLQQAIALAQSIRAPDLAYPAQALLAQIRQTQGELAQAKQAYKASIQNINQVRQQLKGGNSRIQSDFYAQVEPIYHRYLEILFSDSSSVSETIQVSTQLQVAELENFLGCQLDDWTPIHQIAQVDRTTLIFVIRGTQHYQVIIRAPGQADYHYLVDASALNNASFNLVANTKTGDLYQLDAATIAAYGKRFYDVLLKPAADRLPDRGTLTFVLDAALQNTPIDFLHDGRDYLIQKYSLTLTLGAQVRQPKALNPKDLKILLAGVSEVAPSFGPKLPALTQTAAELATIQTQVGGKVLLNQAFTIEQLQAAIAQQDFPIIHLSSHGIFSSNPKQTGIFAWDQILNIPTLKQLVDQQGQRQRSIEVLVLSACETAKGDQRSILGLAGIATQAGARSTIASLWLVNEESTVQLMNDFYRGLKAGLTKAEALRQAKLHLIQSPDFNHPFFWGSFTLIGSWL